ncbi:MAG: hypothetical protein ACT4QC_04620 [Planctomycetaceae bacterium]
MLRLLFQIGRSPDGRFRLAPLPVYQIVDWRCVGFDNESMTYRPSWPTLIRRLGVTLLAAIFFGLLVAVAGVPWRGASSRSTGLLDEKDRVQAEERLRESRELEKLLQLPDRPHVAEELARKQQQREAELAAQRTRFERLEIIRRGVLWIVTGGLVALGLVPLIVLPFESLTILRGRDGELIVCRRRILATEKSWPPGSFGGIVCEAMEWVHRPRRRSFGLHQGWVWIVRLAPGRNGLVLPYPTAVGESALEFVVGRQKDRPLDAARPLAPVQSFISRLRDLAGVSEVAYGLLPDRGAAGPRRRTVIYESEPLVNETTYHSLREMPPKLQSDVRKLISDGVPAEGVVHHTTRISIRDSAGNEKIYTSIDDLPPDVRKRFEIARRKAHRKEAGG